MPSGVGTGGWGTRPARGGKKWAMDPFRPAALCRGEDRQLEAAGVRTQQSIGDRRQAYPSQAVEPELACGGGREIDHPSAQEWTTVVDAHNDSPAIAVIGDAHLGAERERAVGRRKSPRIRMLAAGGLPAAVRVNGCDPFCSARASAPSHSEPATAANSIPCRVIILASCAESRHKPPQLRWCSAAASGFADRMAGICVGNTSPTGTEPKRGAFSGPIVGTSRCLAHSLLAPFRRPSSS
jgi:hypothetical protein